MIKTLPELHELRTLFSYDHDAGTLRWNIRPRSHFKSDNACNAWNARYANTPAGCINSHGYLAVGICYKRYSVHRVIWKLHHKKEPPEIIDHIDGNSLNNHISNLRGASRAENASNSKVNTRNKLGVKGVESHRRKFRARIFGGGVSRHLGLFGTVEEAHQAYIEAAKIMYKDFTRP